ncbi:MULTISPECIES: OsmC family protein [Sporosarcina]|uniref:OsmC family protein n=1 Tax=Sporosarcina contaminans TaxID=633403 RepID=A0ABW3TW06_9BACL
MIFEMTENGFVTSTSFGKLEVSSDEAYGFRPYQLLVSSIAVCSGGVLRKILDKKRMPAKHISIEVREVKRNPEIADRVEKIHLHFLIDGIQAKETVMDKVMELTSNNCSMVQSVAGSIEIVKTYELQN